MSGRFAAAPHDSSPTASFMRDAPEARDDDFEIDSEGAGLGVTPIYARVAARKNAGPSKAVLFGVPLAIAAAGAVAYFAMQPRHEVMAEAAPVAPVAAPMTSAPALETAAAAPAPMPADTATTTTAAAEPMPVNPTSEQRVSGSVPAATPAAPRREAPVRVARARPAQTAPSVDTSAQDASAMMPGAPVPYSATTSGGAPAAPMINAAPAPSPAPADVAPTQPTAPSVQAAPVNPDPTAPAGSAIP